MHAGPAGRQRRLVARANSTYIFRARVSPEQPGACRGHRIGPVLAPHRPTDQDGGPHGTKAPEIRWRRPEGCVTPGDDAFKLTVDYLKQEALEPLKGLGRFLLWGLTGSLAIAVGILLVLVGILRLLQDRDRHRAHRGLVVGAVLRRGVLGIGVAAVAGWRITRRARTREAAKRGPRHGTRRRKEAADGEAREQRAGASPGRICRPPTPRCMGEGEATARRRRAAGHRRRRRRRTGPRHPGLPGRPAAGAQPLGRRRDPAAVGDLVDALLRRLLRAAVRRGLAGDWTWLAVAACAYVLRRALRPQGRPRALPQARAGRADPDLGTGGADDPPFDL